MTISRVLSIVSCLLLTVPALAGPPRNGDVLIGKASSGKKLPASDPLEPLLVAIDTPYEIFDDAGTFVHVAAWMPDGKPARGARVYLAGHLVGKTSKHGSLVFRWGVPGADVKDYWTNGSQISVRLDKGKKSYGGDVWFSALSRTESFASDHLYVYTDRGVYAPGQSVLLRSIGWHLDVDYAALTEKTVEYVLSDPSGTTVGAAQVKTNSFGVASSELKVPLYAQEGIYTLSATYAGATAEQRLRVEHFEPPTIDIQHTLGRFLTADTKTLSFDVALSYFTGGDVEAATVRVSASARGEVRYTTTREVKGRGPHSLKLDSAALEKVLAGVGEGELVEIALEVEDGFGRKDTLTREMRFTANPYVVVIESDRDAWSPGDPVELVVRMTDRDRVPVRKTPVTLKSDRGDVLEATSDDKGTVRFSLEMKDAGFSVEVFLPGVDAPVASRFLAWQQPQPMRSHIAEPIVTENAKATISVSFPADFVPVEKVVHVDVVDTSGSLVNAVLIPISEKNGVYTAKGSFTAPSWGSMLLTLFCLGEEKSATKTSGSGDDFETHLGLLTEGQQMVVHPGRELQIQLDGVPDTVAPGSALSGTIVVRNGAGEKVNASVGVALVDESVISLKDPLEITPMDLFYNPELRTISTTGSAILTWPVVSRNWGGAMHDIALPPFPWHGGGRVQQALGGLGGSMGGGGIGAMGSGSGGGGYGMGSGKLSAKKSSKPKILGFDPPATDGAEAPEEEEEEMDVSRRDRGMAGKPKPEPVSITIRTEFPETALWAPALEAKAGKVALEARVSDAITRQQFTIVASDGQGGVGVLRQSVHVSQPLHVRADVPDALVVGDQVNAVVVVSNLGAEAEQVTLSLRSPVIKATFVDTPTVKLEPGETVAARVVLEAMQAGEAAYTVEASGNKHRDVEEQTVHVRPSGTPSTTVWAASLEADKPFRETLEVPSGGELTTATLNVVFPAVSTAFAGLDAIRAQALDPESPMELSGELIAMALLYEHAQRTRPEAPQTAALRGQLENALFWLLALQRQDGGWGHRWTKASSPYVTGYVLEALLELERLDFGVPRESITRAQNALVASRTGDTWDQSAIAFWEGNTEAVRMGLTAELFHVLARMPDRLISGPAQKTREELATLFLAELEKPAPDVMTRAHAALGLMRLGKLDAEKQVAVVKQLDEMRKDAHWEPSWFNAYGGTIEATVAVLQVLKEAEPGSFERVQRDALRYLLSTRDGWGGWHNPRGTASAIRGLLMLGGLERESAAAQVEVLVDDAVVKTVVLDPSDPWLSSMPLRALDLSPYLTAGTHAVEVRYTGAMRPHLKLTLQHWDGASSSAASALSVKAEFAEATLSAGAQSALQLDLASTSEEAVLVRLSVPLPALLEVSEEALKGLAAQPSILQVSVLEGRLVLVSQLAAKGASSYQIPVRAVRRGEARMGAVLAEVLPSPGRAVVMEPAVSESLAVVVK